MVLAAYRKVGTSTLTFIVDDGQDVEGIAVIVTCTLRNIREPLTQSRPGVDFTGQLMQGRVLRSKPADGPAITGGLDPRITTGQRATAAIINGLDCVNFTITIPSTRNPWQDKTGQLIQGRWNDGNR